MNDADDYYYTFLKMSKQEIKGWLKDYASNPSPRQATFQWLARVASAAYEGTPIEDIPPSYTKTKYGVEFYFHMIGLN